MPTATALDPGVQHLLASPEPIIRYRTLRDLMDAADDDPEVKAAAASSGVGPVVSALLRGDPADAHRAAPRHPYSKWAGVHWRLVSLMDLGVPKETVDTRLVEPVLRWLTSGNRLAKMRPVAGRTRRCASQEGNALAVGVQFEMIADPRVSSLAQALVSWQWPDGGWNCDRRPEADHSSVNETWPALRGLASFARVTGDRDAREAVDRAAEFILRHRVGWSERTGRPIHTSVLRIHYPPYWHYDLLSGLRALAESGHVTDPRAAKALDLLESKRRPDGTWHPEGAHYRSPRPSGSLVDVVDWGSEGARDALTLSSLLVLRAAGRLGS